MSLPTVETHVLVTELGSYDNFVVYKLPHFIWGYDYLVFWRNGGNAAYFNSKNHLFGNLAGGHCTNVKFEEKPKDTPWTPEDAVKHLGEVVYEPNGSLGGSFVIDKVSSDKVYGKFSINMTYDQMMVRKCYIGKEEQIPAYHKAQR